jgi:hypothetical protein
MKKATLRAATGKIRNRPIGLDLGGGESIIGPQLLFQAATSI